MTTKAVRAQIKLGDTELDVYQKPNGDYAISLNAMKDQLGIFTGNKTGKKYVQPLLEANFEQVNLMAIEGTNAKAKLVDLSLFSSIVAKYAELGNTRALSLVLATFAESLERRADAAQSIPLKNSWLGC